MKRSLGKELGVETIFHHDAATDVSTIEHKQDVSALVDKNKALHNTSYQRDGIKQEWVHAASIPEIVQIKWMREHGIKDIYSEEYWPLIKRLLNSPEYRYLKTGTMKV